MLSNKLSDYCLQLSPLFSPELCSRLIAEYSSGTDVWAEFSGLEALNISLPATIELNERVRAALDSDVFEAMKGVVAEYKQAVELFYSTNDLGYALLRLGPGQKLSPIVDMISSSAPRHTTCLVPLARASKGGEFKFVNRRQKLTTEVGRPIVFPCGYMTPYEITEVGEGTAYYLVSYFV